ncbi:MAG: hypothetical protein ACK53K_07605 [Burkholderiales bacterium]
MLFLWTISMLVLTVWGASALRTESWLPVLACLALLMVLVCAYGLASGWAGQPASVRWDGQFWHWGPLRSVGQEPSSGRATVCIDLGFFILVRLQPWGASPWRGVWWAVERRQHGTHWHILRCALQPGSGA